MAEREVRAIVAGAVGELEQRQDLKIAESEARVGKRLEEQLQPLKQDVEVMEQTATEASLGVKASRHCCRGNQQQHGTSSTSSSIVLWPAARTELPSGASMGRKGQQQWRQRRRRQRQGLGRQGGLGASLLETDVAARST